MRVLHVVPYYPPDRVGGVGEVVAHLHLGLLSRGHRSTVLTTGTSKADPQVIRFTAAPVSFLCGLPRFAALTEGYDVVHCHQGDAIGLILAMRARRISTPVVATFHVGHRGMAHAARPYTLSGRRFSAGWKGLFYRHATARVHRLNDWGVLRLADDRCFVARSAAIDVMGPRQAETAKVIYAGLPELDENPTPSPRTGAELLFVGLPSHRKRVLALPSILRRVRRTIPGARLRIVGFDMAEVPELSGLLREFGLSAAVQYEGAIHRDAVRPFYEMASVLVVPSAYEGLPLVILEAQQCGLPCVVSRVSGHPEVIEDGRNGFLVDVDDADSMADRCVQLLEDRQLRHRMGSAGKARVAKQFGLDRFVDEHVALYRGAVSVRDR